MSVKFIIWLATSGKFCVIRTQAAVQPTAVMGRERRERGRPNREWGRRYSSTAIWHFVGLRGPADVQWNRDGAAPGGRASPPGHALLDPAGPRGRVLRGGRGSAGRAADGLQGQFRLRPQVGTREPGVVGGAD